jgi:hypothetical protein
VYLGLELRRVFTVGRDGRIGAGGARAPGDTVGEDSELFVWRTRPSRSIASCNGTWLRLMASMFLFSGKLGLAEVPCRPCIVELLDVVDGDSTCEARDSTSSMVLDCQPWLTLTIA